MSEEKKKTKITVRITDKQADAAETIKKDLGMSVAEQFRDAFSFWGSVIYGLGTNAIEEEDAIKELKKYASVIEGKHKEPQLWFKKAMEEFGNVIQDEKEKGEDEELKSPLIDI